MAFKNWGAFVDKYENDDELMELLDKSGINWGKLPNDEARFEAMYNFLRTKPKTWEKEKYDELWLDFGERNYENKQGFKYNPKSIMGELGNYEDIEKDGVKTSALDQFRKDYWSASKDKRDYWKTKFEKAHGQNSWELVKKVMQADLHNKMMSDIEKKRSDIIEGEAEESPWYDYVNSSLMGLFTPRIKSALKEGRDISATDVLGDLTENAAYAAFPVGRVGGLVAKGIARPLSKLFNQTTAKGAGKLLGGALAEFGAPATIEAADYGLNKADTWLTGAEDDARFEPEDILLGGFTNLGVNKGLGRTAGLALNTMGKKVSGKIPKPIRERLEGVKSPKEKAEEMIDNAKETLLDANMNPMDVYKYAVKEGKAPPDMQAQENAIRILKIAEQADPKMRTQAIEYANKAKEEATKNRDMFAQKLDDLESRKTGAGIEHETGVLDDKAYTDLVDELDIDIGNARELMDEYTDDVLKADKRITELNKSAKAQEILDGLSNVDSEHTLTGRNKKILNGPPPAASYQLTPVPLMFKSLEADFGLPEGTFTGHPELLALFGRKVPPTTGERLGEAAFSWAVNKAGTDSDAQVASTITQGVIDPKKLRKGQYERREKAKTGRAAKTLEAVVSSEYDLTDEDKKWLRKISENPGMVKGYGKDAGSTDFTLWMLRRGTDLLRNTELARPAFDVE